MTDDPGSRSAEDDPATEDESDRGRLRNAVEFVLDLGALVADLF